ncbi:MAG: hypothetical protein V4736_12100 [Bdellovibrionota bacterium]
MIKELWPQFPRLMEQRINGLLEEAEPNDKKAFQLYKACQNDGVWKGSYERFAEHLRAFFAMAKTERRKSDFDTFLDRPMDMSVYEDFHLNFRTATVDSRAVTSLTSWAHNLIRTSTRSHSPVISFDTLSKTLNYIINPPFFEKASDITFDDFCSAWKKTVSGIFGNQHEGEFKELLREMKWLEIQLRNSEKNPEVKTFTPTIYLTQTEIDWTLAVEKAVKENKAAPKFPLSRGAEKPRLIDLEGAVHLYNLALTTKHDEVIRQLQKIKTTIIERCESLLREKAS